MPGRSGNKYKRLKDPGELGNRGRGLLGEGTARPKLRRYWIVKCWVLRASGHFYREGTQVIDR